MANILSFANYKKQREQSESVVLANQNHFDFEQLIAKNAEKNSKMLESRKKKNNLIMKKYRIK